MGKALLLLVFLVTSVNVYSDGFTLYVGAGFGFDGNTGRDIDFIVSDVPEYTDPWDDDLNTVSNFLNGWDDDEINGTFGLDMKLGYDFDNSEWHPYVAIVLVNLNPESIVVTEFAPSYDDFAGLMGVSAGMGYDFLNNKSGLQVTMDIGGMLGSYHVDIQNGDNPGAWGMNYLGFHANPHVSYSFEEFPVVLQLQNNIYMPINVLSSYGDQSARGSLFERIVYMPSLGVRYMFTL